MEKAKRNLDKCKAEVEKLQSAKASLSEKIGSLQANRSAAVRALAGGDDQKEAAVQQIEAKIAPLNAKLEGLEALIAESSAAVDQAAQDLKTAMAEDNRRLQAFIAERDRLEHDELISSLPEREEKIIALYQQLCQELAELQIEMHHFGKNGAVVWIKELEDMVQMIPMKIKAGIEENSLRPLITGGSFSGISLWPYVAPSFEISAAFPGKGLLYPEQIARARRQKRVQALTAEYQSSNK